MAVKILTIFDLNDLNLSITKLERLLLLLARVVYDTMMTNRNGLDRINYVISTLIIALSLILSSHISSPALAQPSISVPSSTAELVLDGLSSPTSIAFLDENNILLLEKEGSVRLISNPQILVDLPAGPGTNHQGGKLKIGPDNQLYIIVGEMQREGQLQNIQNGPAPDDTGVILRVNPADGSPSSGNPFSSDPANPLSKYYAYGIRNSFGIEFDPVTRQLWDAENGEDVFDEINLVQPGFNSGWKQVMGPLAANTGVSESSLVNFPGSQYADPVFSWSQSRGVTDIEFFNSTAFGPSYQNGIFVGDITSGTLFYFEPNAARTSIALENDALLSDLIADSDEEISSVTFGTGFTGITDIETGPDGNLYILTFDRGADGPGSLYRILAAGEGDAPVAPPATVTPPPVDEQDEV